MHFSDGLVQVRVRGRVILCGFEVKYWDVEVLSDKQQGAGLCPCDEAESAGMSISDDSEV